MRLAAPLVVAALVALSLVVGVGSPSADAQGTTGNAQRGKYVFQLASCAGCHGQNLAGWREGGPPEQPESAPFGELFEGPFGKVPAANITQDKETGIGDWTDQQILDAVRNGRTTENELLFPIMPYGHL